MGGTAVNIVPELFSSGIFYKLFWRKDMKKISISETTLRFYQKNGGTLSFKEKLEIAKRLSELGVDFIEIAPNLEDKADEVLVKTICACVKKGTISCVVGLSEEDIEKTYPLISSAKKKKLIISIPVSAVQMEYKFGKKPKVVLEVLKTLTKKAKSLCEDVEVSFEDSTRAEQDFLISAINVAIENGANAITLTDLAGVMQPQDVAEFIGKIKEDVADWKDTKLYASFSNEYSMGIANYFSAIKCGVDGVKLSVCKNSELPMLESFQKASEFIGYSNGFITDLNKTALSKLVNQIYALIGGHSASQDKEEEKSTVVSNLDKKSIEETIKKRGYDLSAEDTLKVFEEITKIASKKTVTEKDLDVIIASTAMQVKETYSLVNFSVNSSNVLTATASITLKKDGKLISGLSYGNGSIDASFLALEKITGRHIELDEFTIGAVTEGKEAMGEAIVKLRFEGVIYSGRGVSTDIIGASIKAYVNALNKIVYGEDK